LSGGTPREGGLERIAPARQYPVLYVDDEPDNLLVFKAVLSDEFHVLLAQSAAEALTLLEREPIAVLVVDQRMPHINGIELCRMVSERLPAVRRILLTAYSDHQTAIQAINRGGVHGYLEKPWDPPTMRRALWEAVNRVHLDRMVAELRAALADRDARLESARSLDLMLHDMGNAAQRLSLSTRVLRKLLETHAGAMPREVRVKLEREAGLLERAEEHLRRLQRERADTGAMAPKPEPLRVDELLSTVAALSAFPPGERMRLVAHSSPGLRARADRVAATRVLVNLVKNARQAIEEAGDAEGEVHISARAEAGQVVIDVADSGPGIPPALRERIFDEYFTTRRASGGTGLGLAGARELARANGGALELPNPQPERGALFRLTLPAEGASAQPSESRPAHP
jgi:signal transduction histidine kinase